MTHRRRRRIERFAVLVGALAVLAGAGTADARPTVPTQNTPTSVDADWHTLVTPPLADGQFELLTLSTLPDMVTGGDVLVAVRGLGPATRPILRAGDRDVSAALQPVDGADEWRGLVTDLPDGPTTLVAQVGPNRATLDIVNHPVTGPVISGPHQEPFACRTADAGLGDPLDDDCSVAPTYEWFYRSSLDQGFTRLSDPYAPYPDDVAVTETDDGDAVPFVVRVESRTINRGIARIAVLDDPAARGPEAPFEPALWNERVYYAYGESCGVGYQQGTNSPEMVLGGIDLAEVNADNLLINLVGISDRLGSGDIIVHSTLSSFGVHCNPVVSIETTTMIKEHLTETYGLIDVVIGTNGSGAALQQYNAANNAPGLIDGAMPTATFADIVTTAMTVTDCGLLNHYRSTTSLEWSDEQWAAATGHHPLTALDLNDICVSWEDTFLDRVDPTTGCAVPAEDRYHPDTNPTGVRCTIQDANVNLFGTDERGFARRPLDNVGVQYGYEAYRAGDISLEQFVDLNERVGGYDIDGRPIPERHAMSSELAAHVYRIGGVIGRGALDETPVLDLAPYLDLIPVANIHEAVRPFVVRDRLRALSSTDQTQVIWRGVLTQADAYGDMSAWVDATNAARPDHGGDHTAAVVGARPANFGDRCSFGTIGGALDLPAEITGPLGLVELPLLPGSGLDGPEIPLRVDVPEDFDSGIGVCTLALPVGGTPRMAAGMPRSDDVIKCQLKPIAAADYPGITDAQLEQLRTAFPDGVCDYSKPAAEDVDHSMLWVSFGSTTREEPHELTWRVGRSTARGVASAEPVPATVSGRLPATGGPALPVVAVGAVVVALVARARRVHAA